MRTVSLAVCIMHVMHCNGTSRIYSAPLHCQPWNIHVWMLQGQSILSALGVCASYDSAAGPLFPCAGCHLLRHSMLFSLNASAQCPALSVVALLRIQPIHLDNTTPHTISLLGSCALSRESTCHASCIMAVRSLTAFCNPQSFCVSMNHVMRVVDAQREECTWSNTADALCLRIQHDNGHLQSHKYISKKESRPAGEPPRF